MDISLVMDTLKKRIMIHRLIYVIFCFHRLALQFNGAEVELRDTIVLLTLVGICFGIDTVFLHYDYFDNIKVIQGIRFVQCVIATVMLVFFAFSSDSEIMIFNMIILFFTDFFLAQDVQDKEIIGLYLLLISLPIIAGALARLVTSLYDGGMLMFFNLLSVLLVISSLVVFVNGYLLNLYHRMIEQRFEIENLNQRNQKVIDIQERMKTTNMLLNVQKSDLQYANRKIKEANEEMVAQADILHFISLSFEVPKISNQIVEAIMRVKKLGFCAAYIKEDVYLNKHANYVIRTDIAQLQSKIKDNMEAIYQNMLAEGVNEQVVYDDVQDKYLFLKEVDINSVYVRLLEHEGELYGLFMLGDQREHLFDDELSFYDAILAQYNIAISNARIYNEMQYMARKDGLTGINNRVYFTQLFKNTVENIKESDSCLSVALFDIDKFKSVNDTYGHLAGDEVIKRIASVTEAFIDQYDGFVCRYGGEEFVAVLPDRKLEVAQPIIEELFEELCSQIVHYEEWDIPMSVSVGLTSYPEICENTDDLLKRADWCMYYAKEHGRHQVNVDDGSIQRD